jgi:hypothetical protein
MPFMLYDDQFPSHPKVVDVKLRDRTALTLHLLCGTWSSAGSAPGFVTEAAAVEQAGSRARAKKWAAALVDAGLWHAPGHDCGRCPQITAGWVYHDWIDYNPDAEEVARRRAEISRKRSEAGARGAASRWGKRGKPDGKSHTEGMANANSQHGNRDGNDVAKNGTPSPSPSPVVSSVGDSSSVADARAKPDDEDSKIENRIITELAEQTGHTVSPEHAAAVRRQLLDGRPDVRRRVQYVVAAIRGEPRRYLPADAVDPHGRTVAEALDHRPKNPDAYDRGAAAAREALRRTP